MSRLNLIGIIGLLFQIYSFIIVKNLSTAMVEVVTTKGTSGGY